MTASSKQICLSGRVLGGSGLRERVLSDARGGIGAGVSSIGGNVSS